ncbi:MAG TPA: hypothetical protein VFV90_02430 [Usitatibacter sp.]|nr:hypothetical protein [Usitatibacter sp.]
MFVGHFGVGLAAKGLAPRASLGTLFLAAQFLDLLWPTLLLIGVERAAIVPGVTAVTPLDFEHYPISHSLLAVVAWSAGLGGAYFAITGRWKEALVVAVLVTSHWLLDAVVHRPDLPLSPFGPERVGLGLWNSLPATLLVEVPIFIGGCWLYARVTRPRDAIGRWAFAGLAAFLVVTYAMNLAGDPPPSMTAVAWVGQAQWLLVLWAAWVDRHREAA